tara:strand:- start:290 stop:454 length:165 start_codon:yes stop_codon:yes gene_type:complete
MKLSNSKDIELYKWVSQFVDDITTIEIDGDKVYLRVNGEIVGLLTFQRLIRRTI